MCYLNHGQLFSNRQSAFFLRNHLLLSAEFASILKGVIEGAIGVKDVLALKSQVEEQIGAEVSWSESQKTTQTFTYKTPPYGRCTLTIYQLIRIYELTYLRKKWFSWSDEVWSKKWIRSLPELTNKYDALPDYEEYDELCHCPDSPRPSSVDGQLLFDFGQISFRAPFRVTSTKVNVQVLDKTIALQFPDLEEVNKSLEHGFEALIPANLIPEPLIFLGSIQEVELKAEIQKVSDVQISDLGYREDDVLGEQVEQGDSGRVNFLTIQGNHRERNHRGHPKNSKFPTGTIGDEEQ